MRVYSKTLKEFLDAWPGKKRFGIYRFLPLFFLLGASLEFSMINWHVGEVNFYRTYKRRQARKIAEEILASREST
ncbi:ubiquinol-cytochrome c reductase complex assembly factor 5 [Anabrus simplex]|uniref:ubiquinol-cytochrome c reductase complex assembly factor 5 n=1 Tax=Anabrus simplex TaxID=316456 RepID=UPI0034DD4C09